MTTILAVTLLLCLSVTIDCAPQSGNDGGKQAVQQMSSQDVDNVIEKAMSKQSKLRTSFDAVKAKQLVDDIMRENNIEINNDIVVPVKQKKDKKEKKDKKNKDKELEGQEESTQENQEDSPVKEEKVKKDKKDKTKKEKKNKDQNKEGSLDKQDNSVGKTRGTEEDFRQIIIKNY